MKIVTTKLLALMCGMMIAQWAFSQPVNDNCSTATSLDTLPRPAACTGTSLGTNVGATITLTGQTTAGGTPSSPYIYNADCSPDLAHLPSDVWYSFIASGYQATIKVSAAFANPMISVYEGSCDTMQSLACATGVVDSVQLIVYNLTAGHKYYIQVSGHDSSQSGTFTISAHNDNNCGDCLVQSTLTASPPPVNGAYAPGQRVTFYFTVTNWDEISSNWFHGMSPSFAGGWDLSTLTPGPAPATCSRDGGHWEWHTGDTSSATLSTFPAGFYYETSSGNTNNAINNNPGDNYGDQDSAGCTWQFTVSITTSANIDSATDLSAAFSTSADGESGSWSSSACGGDEAVRFYAHGGGTDQSVCIGGTATVAATGSGTWAALASNPATTTITTPSSPTTTISGFTIAGTYRFTWAGDTVLVTVNATPATPHLSLLGTCLGQDTLSVQGTGTNTIRWLLDGGPWTPTPDYIPVVAGQYMVYVISGCGVQSGISDTVTVSICTGAGPDQTVSCAILPGGTATMAATGTGTWTAITTPANPGTATITTPSSPTTTITGFSVAGVYKFIWTVGSVNDTATVTVTAKPDAGPDQYIAAITDTATMAAVGTGGSWSALPSNPSVSYFTSPTSPTPRIYGFGRVGTYAYIWSVGGCTDTALVIIGPACHLSGSMTNTNLGVSVEIIASVSGYTGNPAYNWSSNIPINYATSSNAYTINNGIYTVTITDPSTGCSIVLADTVTSLSCDIRDTISYTYLGLGQYHFSSSLSGSAHPGYSWYLNPPSSFTTLVSTTDSFTYTILPGLHAVSLWVQDSITGCYGTDSITIIVPAYQIAGPDQTVSCAILPGGTATMAATGTGTWTAITTPANPGTATITTPSSPTTTITGFSVAGVYKFIWTVGSVNDTATVTVTAKPDAGPDQYIAAITDTATMAAVGTGGSWTALPSNPSVSYFTSPTSPTPRIYGFGRVGTYAYIWSVGGCTDTALVIIGPACHLSGSMTNTNLGVSVEITASVSGYTGNPAYNWSSNIPINYATSSNAYTINNGIYTVTITDPSTGCSIVLADTITSLSCDIRDTISYTYLGLGQYHFSSSLSGSAHPGYSWYLNPPSSFTTLVSTTDSFTYTILPGLHAVSLWVQDSITGCYGTDSITIIVPAYQIGGADQSVCIGGTATMAATGSGTWAALASNPATTTITTPSSPTTTISGFTVAGTYRFTWAGDTVLVTVNATPATPHLSLLGTCLGQDTLSVQGTGTNTIRWLLDGGPWTPTPDYIPVVAGQYMVYVISGCGVQSGISDTVTVSTCTGAGPDQTICQNNSFGDATATMAATGTGIWSTLSTNPSTTTINDSISPTTYITGFTGPGVYGFVWRTPAPDTVYFTVLPGPARPVLDLTGQCFGSDTLILTQVYGDSIVWIHGTTDIFSTDRDSVLIPSLPGFYQAYIYGSNGCYSGLSDTVSVISCTIDTVWPGDADANHIVDNNDLLTIGLGYDSTGPLRAVTGYVWQADLATDWSHNFTIYAPTVNFNNADCNGDGIINADDTLAIVTNFGLIHAKNNGYNGTWRNGIPALGLRMILDTVYNGTILTTDILLGDSAIPINNIYGLAFTLNYDASVTDSNAAFTVIPSWLGSSTNSINIAKRFASTGQIKAAITGIDHTARSGSGTIATFIGEITTGNINGKDYSYYTNVMYISDVTAIDQYGNPVPLNAGIDSDYIGYYPNGIRDVSRPVMIDIYPNPASTQVLVRAGAAMHSITITDMLGKEVQTIATNGKLIESIDISALAAGVYTVRVSAASGSATSKLIISR